MYFKSSNCKNIATNILEFPIFVKNNVFNEIRAIKIFCRVSGLIRKRQKYKIVILNKHFLKQQSFTKLANVHLGLGSGNDSVEETKRYEVNELSVSVPRRREEPICLTFSCKMASYSLYFLLSPSFLEPPHSWHTTRANFLRDPFHQ